MTVTETRGGREVAVALVRSLDAWCDHQPHRQDLHSGDLGWHLRNDDATLDGSLLAWQVDGAPAALGMVDGGVLRCAVAPDRRGHRELAEAMAEAAVGQAYADVADDLALHAVLSERGWTSDPDPWVLLHRRLGPADADTPDPAVHRLESARDVADRCAVQRSAFHPGSTFFPDLWERMAQGPTYDTRFELLARTATGEPAAAATGWFAGPGRCAILEPVGTHADHRRQGYGSRVNRAVIAALAAAGASGVRVHTPASNAGAVAAYAACGMHEVRSTRDLVAPTSAG